MLYFFHCLWFLLEYFFLLFMTGSDNTVANWKACFNAKWTMGTRRIERRKRNCLKPTRGGQTYCNIKFLEVKEEMNVRRSSYSYHDLSRTHKTALTPVVSQLTSVQVFFPCRVLWLRSPPWHMALLALLSPTVTVNSRVFPGPNFPFETYFKGYVTHTIYKRWNGIQKNLRVCNQTRLL